MSPFDFFKKPKKDEAGKAFISKPTHPPIDEAFKSPEMQKKRHDAALEFLKAFQEKMPLVHGKPHAGTVLAVVARLAGTSLYRSLNYKNDAVPGIAVLSEEVNQAWPPLMNAFAYYCKKNGLDIMAKPMMTKFPDKDKSFMDTDQVLQEYQDQYHGIMKKFGLDYLNGAYAGIIVSSIIFEYHCHRVKDIDPFVAAGIVAMGIVEGAKTAPPPLGSGKPESTSPVENTAQNSQFMEVVKSIAKNSTDGSGKRLVLGEEMASMQEALSKGGKYILVHPEVVNKLKQNNMDPYLVYETALIMEVESKIPQIDFIGNNIDELLREWNTKPQSQAPFHVRQMLWLNTNAKGLGYERQGNSWVLK